MHIRQDDAETLMAAINPSRPRLTKVPPSVLTSFVTSVPADASLVAGQFKLWLDATPGATKLMIKAKDSGGTVRTGSVALA